MQLAPIQLATGLVQLTPVVQFWIILHSGPGQSPLQLGPIQLDSGIISLQFGPNYYYLVPVQLVIFLQWVPVQFSVILQLGPWQKTGQFTPLQTGFGH